MWSVLLSTEGDYQFKVLFLENEFESVKALLKDAPEFINHYPDFNNWLSNALHEASIGKRLVYGLYLPRVTPMGTADLKLIGVSIVKIRNETAELKTLFIGKNFRNDSKRYGTNLYQKVEEQLAKKGVTRVVTDVPYENKLVIWFLIQQGFQINGLIDRYKKGDSNYLLSKDVKGYYTEDNFDWHKIVSWFLENIYQVKIDYIQKTPNKACNLVPILNCNLNIVNDSLPPIKGVSLICDMDVTLENIKEIEDILESQVENVLMIFLKNFDESNRCLLNQDKYLIFNEKQVYQECGCPIPSFNIERISGIIVEMKRDYFEKFTDSEKEYTYIKGSAVGKFVKENDLIIFYVDSDVNNPYGGLVGYGKINEVYCGSPYQLWSKYEDKNPLFSEEDFKKFSNYRNEVIAIAFKDYIEIDIIHYEEFIKLFQNVIFTKELGNMYVNEDFVKSFTSYVETKRGRSSQQLIPTDSIVESGIHSDEEKSSKLEEMLLADLISACQHLQGRAKAVNSDENSRNSIITLTLTAYHHGYTSHDQSLYGSSATGKSSGEVDIRFEDNLGNTISICEAFILKSIDTSVIDNHLIKIFRYDSNGLNRNYIVVYAESNNFIALWSRYLEHIKTIDFEYPIVQDVEDISNGISKCTDIKVALVKHGRSDRLIEIYHIFVNMKI